ncbi:VanZ like family protein [Singulisphaera sp. GP187]|uniref:VanZ family protein n=1 Tax=Singulisphaera sp. GP187 TaxID=1882752 RepID=UPI00092BE102|nr:VanZ family protein [Singulisphaera sp. GP187]SIN67694.1 VanZ like family protein [Singulisphaera sp. GP187]
MPPYDKSDRDTRPIRTKRSSCWSRYAPVGLILIGTLTTWVLGGLAMLRYPGLPYNLRELMESSVPGVTLGILGLCLLITGATPLLLAWLWDRRPGEFTWIGPLDAISIAALIYSLLRTAVPYESISDIIGSPVLKLPAELENLGRFVGLYLGILMGLTIGTRLTIGNAPRRRDLAGLLSMSVMAAFSYTIVVGYACTDNIVELLRDGGSWLSAGAVLAFVALLGLVAGALSLATIRAAEGHWRPLAGAIVLLLISIPVGWLLLCAATNPSLTKYGRTFAAREFLFSPDREHPLGERAIFLRFAIAELSTMALLSVGMLVGRLMVRAREAPPSRIRPQPTRTRPQPREGMPAAPPRRIHYALLSALYAGFAIYGSLVPLQFRAVPLDQAWERFRQIPYLQLSIESRSDWVANILLFVPLGFLLAGVHRVDRPGGRYRDLAAAAWIVPGCALLSIAIEFTQIWFPPRTVSQNDVAAEVIGAMAGVGIWSLAGRRATMIAREYLGTSSSGRKLDLILKIYLVGLLIYSVLPLDLTLSPADLWRKYRDGKMLLFTIGGTNPLQSAYVILATTATFVPVGLLVASLFTPLPTRFGNLVRSLTIGAALAALIEIAQILVYSRVSNGADLLWGALGVSLGVACMRPETTPNAARQRTWPDRPWVWLCLTLGYAGVLAAIFWFPFEFTAQKGLVLERLAGMARVPYSALYRGSDWNAMTQITRKVLWFIPLGSLMARGIALVSSRSPAHRRVWIVSGLLACLTLAVTIEVGQTLLPEKVADLTDILLYQSGATLGLMMTLSLLDLRAKSEGGGSPPF